MSAMAAGRLVIRVPLLAVHLLISLPVTLLCFIPGVRAIPVGDRTLDRVMQCWWARRVCRVFGLRRQVTGRLQDGPVLIAANHISWLDIQLLHSIAPMGFVAKSEIENWPLAGWLARLGETVFHRRGSHDSASSVTAAMIERLQEGRKVAFFAEGGILPGGGVKHFHARLFAAAIECQVPVQPVMIRYLRQGQLYPDITFRPGENFVSNFFRLLRQPSCIAQVHLLPVIEPREQQRRQLASQTQAAVETAFASGLT